MIFDNYSPSSLVLLYMKIARWEDDIEANITSNDTYLTEFTQDVNHEYFSRYQWRKGPKPNDAWTWPVITGHRYRIHWGEANDIENMDIELGTLWQETDNNVQFMMNFTDVRASINMTTDDGYLIPNETFTSIADADQQFGDNVVYNQTEVREFHFAVNARNESRRHIKMEGFRCVVNCELPEVEEAEISDAAIPWSSPDSWPSGAVPVEDEEVEIPSGAWIEFDMEETPLLKSLTVNGRLSFKNDVDAAANRTINSHWVFVRAGELIIGSEEEPYNGIATIRLYGEPIDEAVAFSMFTEGGNKGIMNVGLVKMYGKDRDQMTRLRADVFKGDNSATVYPGLDWVEGDQVALLCTATQWTHTDYMTISSYDSQTGVVVFNDTLKYYHYGTTKSTADDYSGIDMRGEVVLLTRNVRVVGNDTDSWGAQIVTSDTIELNGVQRMGQLIFDNVECYNCSQRNTEKAGIRFENAVLSYSSVTNSVVWGGLSWNFAAIYSKNINVEKSYFIGGRQVGVGVYGSQNVTFDQIVVGDIIRRPEVEAIMSNTIDKEACVTICGFYGPDSKCYDNKITNSISAGCVYAGFVVPGHNCGDADTQDNFRGNVAHSIDQGGAYIFPDVTGDSHHVCYEASHFAAYKAGMTGAGAHFTS